MKQVTHSLAIATLLFFIGASTAYCQLWEQTSGPGGDWIRSIAVNGQGHIFVASRSLHRSTDNGASWKQLFPELPNFSLVTIFAQPSGALILLLQHYPHPHQLDTAISGIYRSTDNGDSWSRIANSAYVWQGANGDLFTSKSSQVFRSKDDGSSWTGVGFTAYSYIYDVNSDYQGRMFICGDFIYRSTDDGKSWGKVLNGVPTSKDAFSQVKVAPNGKLFGIRTSSGSSDYYLYYSLDGGRTWEDDSNFAYGVSALSISANGHILAGAMYSSDFGSTWKKYQFNDGALAMAAEQSNTFVFASTENLYRFDPAIALPQVIPLPNGNVTACISPVSGVVVASKQSGYNNIYEREAELWQSTDKGSTWQLITKLGDGYEDNGVSSFVKDSANDLVVASAGNILLSTDNGAAWSTLRSKLTTDATISSLAVSSNGTIFAASTIEGIFRSTDNGLTWDQLNAGITDKRIYSLAVHQNGDVYAGSRKTIFRSRDNALTWTAVPLVLPDSATNVTALVVSTQGNIIAGIEKAGVYWSTDNGNTWSERAQGFNAGKVYALLSTPVGKVFAGTDNGVFYLDTVAGVDWVSYNGGLTAKNILSLCRDASGRIYAGTDASGVFRSIETFNIIVPSNVNRLTGRPSKTGLESNYPNPFSHLTTIPFSLLNDGVIKLEVVDIRGSSVGILAEGLFRAGMYEVSFDGSNLPNGSYMIALYSDAGIDKVMTITKR